MKNSILFLLIFCLTVFGQSFENVKSKALNSISTLNLINTVKQLTSKKFRGRLSGDRGYNLAVKFSASIFEKVNLKSFYNGSYLQPFSVESNEILSKYKFEIFDKNGKKEEIKLGADFVFRGFTGNGDVSGKFIFCGYGISNNEIGYDDYLSLEVTGKIVVVFKYNPRWTIGGKSVGNPSLRAKAKIAKEKGAIAIVFISLPNDKLPQKPIGSIIDGNEEHLTDFPMLHLSLDYAEKIFSNQLKIFQTEIDSLKKGKQFESSFSARILVNTKYIKNAKTFNVVGFIPGSDSLLKNEFVVLGAHLDHVGSQAGELIFPGANDDASGSAAVLEIAKVFYKQNLKPKRSIIFVLFASEEIGLAGSKFFVNNSPVHKEKIVAMLNMDCIGFGDSIQIGNGKSAPSLFKIAQNFDSVFTKSMINETWSGGGADASPFHDANIPSLYFVTKNSYKYLHLPGDTYQSLNKDLFTKITKLAFLTLFEISNGKYKKETITK